MVFAGSGVVLTGPGRLPAEGGRCPGPAVFVSSGGGCDGVTTGLSLCHSPS